MTLQNDANHQVAAPCNTQPSNQIKLCRCTNSNVPGKLDRDVAVAMDHLRVTNLDQMLTVARDQGPPASYCAMDVVSLDISSAIVLLHYSLCLWIGVIRLHQCTSVAQPMMTRMSILRRKLAKGLATAYWTQDVRPLLYLLVIYAKANCVKQIACVPQQTTRGFLFLALRSLLP